MHTPEKRAKKGVGGRVYVTGVFPSAVLFLFLFWGGVGYGGLLRWGGSLLQVARGCQQLH